jgi:hypothetical protein
MPQFKSTKNILKDFGDEVFHENWMDSDKIILPPSYDWSYDRVMEFEDVDIWEVIIERGGGVAVYAAWCPYAEYYIIRHNWGEDLEAFYGRSVQPHVIQRLEELKIPYNKDAHFRFSDRTNEKNYEKYGNGNIIYTKGPIESY